MRAITCLVLSLASTVAAAAPIHAKKAPAPAPAPVVVEEPVAEPAPVVSSRRVSIAPPEEAGWKVVEIPGGYYRYRPSDRDEGEPTGEAPGVSVIARSPAPPVVAEAAPESVQPVEGPQMTGDELGAYPEQGGQAANRCVAERWALAQRLVYLRGLWTVDGPTADLVLSERSVYGPYIQRSIFGMPGLEWAAPQLLNEAVTDTTTLQLTTELAHCLAGL